MDQDATNCSDSGANQTHSACIPSDETVQQLGRIGLMLMPYLNMFSWGIGVVGIVGNILTVLVFAKLGFAETINISYVALAVSDLLCVLSTMVTSFLFSPAMRALLHHYRVQVDLVKFANFTSFLPQFAFSRTTAFLTAWISLERCLCVLFPTRVRLIITRRVTKLVVFAIFVLGCGPAVLECVTMETDWRFDPDTNTTTLLIYHSLKKGSDVYHGIYIILYGAVYPLLSWIMVTVCTIFLVTKLRDSAKWRKANAYVNSTTNRSAPKTHRNARRGENRTTKTVVMIACMFIVCSLPKSVQSLMGLAFRNVYSVYGSLRLLFVTNAAFALVFMEINSSLNIIFYSITGAKFRSTLKKMFLKK
ncbi:hypothetical protein EGW08_017808 [Elysia chlorotica]|uniref:G-protein coupled receptors family 1 profile domain-containing protein n=1 Tax=Elysia chlorotica TaxID=188477 RepID=A0A3S0ZGQ5_ELYCH|nr:hypothetical protein EGW08_017808 [Elysia chlorotica]